MSVSPSWYWYSCLVLGILMDFHSCPIVELSAIPSWDSQPKKWREAGYRNVANELWCKIDNSTFIAFHEMCLNTILTRRLGSTQAPTQDNMNTSSTVDIFNWHLMCITVETKHIGRVRISLTVKVAPIPVPSVRAPPPYTHSALTIFHFSALLYHETNSLDFC